MKKLVLLLSILLMFSVSDAYVVRPLAPAPRRVVHTHVVKTVVRPVPRPNPRPRPVYYHNNYVSSDYSFIWPTILVMYSLNHANNQSVTPYREKESFTLKVCNNVTDNCDVYYNPKYELYSDELIVYTSGGNRVYPSYDYNFSIKN